jgi:SpoVK/Ycf46/Vps4 family AAA+-type ATPase
MTQETITQVLNQAHSGDVFAMALAGQLLCDGRFVEQNIDYGIVWLQRATQCNCLYARELLTLVQQGAFNKSAQSNGQDNQSAGTAATHHQVAIKNPSGELSKMIGLQRVKTEVESFRNLIKIQKMREKEGLPNTKMNLHCVFTGNPGTGKTTVARIVAGIYKELGVLSKGHLVETDRSGLVAEYVGQTAPKTNKIIDEALDGVLFIDEAYSLLGGENDFGSEAIATLLKRMEDDRDRLVVILAGYTNEIKAFIESNPGLQSRFNRYIQFDDYSADDLLSIFKGNLRKSRYMIKRDACNYLQNTFENAVAHKDKHFGNARYARNVFEKVIQ